ncbi:UNVERIFIED_CONTAM: hypothetical protein K2H54_050465 [Gekko kuhli]
MQQWYSNPIGMPGLHWDTCDGYSCPLETITPLDSGFQWDIRASVIGESDVVNPSMPKDKSGEAGTLRHRLEWQNTHIRPSIPVEKRLAITLWYLANQEYFRELRHLFGVGLSMAFLITKEVCRAIVEELFKKKSALPMKWDW